MGLTSTFTRSSILARAAGRVAHDPAHGVPGRRTVTRFLTGAAARWPSPCPAPHRPSVQRPPVGARPGSHSHGLARGCQCGSECVGITRHAGAFHRRARGGSSSRPVSWAGLHLAQACSGTFGHGHDTDGLGASSGRTGLGLTATSSAIGRGRLTGCRQPVAGTASRMTSARTVVGIRMHGFVHLLRWRRVLRPGTGR